MTFIEKDFESGWIITDHYAPDNRITFFYKDSFRGVASVLICKAPNRKVIFDGTAEEFIEKYDQIFERSYPIPEDMLTKAFFKVNNYLKNDSKKRPVVSVGPVVLDLKAIEMEHGEAVAAIARIYLILNDPTNKDRLSYGQDSSDFALRNAYLEVKTYLQGLHIL